MRKNTVAARDVGSYVFDVQLIHIISNVRIATSRGPLLDELSFRHRSRSRNIWSANVQPHSSSASRGLQRSTFCSLTLQHGNDRDALVKELYARRLGYLVRRVNNSMSCSMRSAKSLSYLHIDLLDIVGLELIKRNSFEQLCTNFAND